MCDSISYKMLRAIPTIRNPKGEFKKETQETRESVFLRVMGLHANDSKIDLQFNLRA